MADILATITVVVTAAVGWLTTFVNTITATPLLMLFVVFGFVGTGVGLLKRLMHI